MIDLVPERLYLRASLYPDKVAIVLPDSGERVTYQSLAQSVGHIAAGLSALGVSRGDRVATLALNGLPQIELLFACAHLGAIFVPLNYRLAEAELRWIGAGAGPKVLCYEQAFAPQAYGVAETTGARLVAIDQPAGGNLPYNSLRDSEPIPALPITQDTPWCILYTGGTTGQPKGAILTHGSILWNAINTDLSWGLREDDVAPIFTPMFHTGGLNVFTLPLLLLGGTLVVPRRFEPAQALRCIVEERATLLFLVPTMYQLLADAPGFGGADFSKVRWAISGGAPCPGHLWDIFSRKARIFKQGYGLTEVGPNNFMTADEDSERKHGSVGRPTLLISTRIVDTDNRDLPPGRVGELLLSGPTVCAGYWRNPEDFARAYDGEWFHTGDLARRDEEGYYYIVDRKGDLIITGGENVYPAEVEAALLSHPAVAEAAVVGVPDPLWGETVVAVLALKESTNVTAEALLTHCQTRIAHYKLPRRFEFWSSLPMSAAGKVTRSVIRRQLREDWRRLQEELREGEIATT